MEMHWDIESFYVPARGVRSDLIFSAHPVWKWSRKIKHLYHFSTCNLFVQLSIARSSNRSIRLTTDPSDGIVYHTQKDFLIISDLLFRKIVSQHTSSMCRRRGNLFEKRMLLMAFISTTYQLGLLVIMVYLLWTFLQKKRKPLFKISFIK
jgi:hypothetical protein